MRKATAPLFVRMRLFKHVNKKTLFPFFSGWRRRLVDLRMKIKGRRMDLLWNSTRKVRSAAKGSEAWTTWEYVTNTIKLISSHWPLNAIACNLVRFLHLYAFDFVRQRWGRNDHPGLKHRTRILP
ncbi:hypothetical protein NC653_036063 [Populus alba x Populus x berolinensis]|uniref:Uncharacterized protein n=1 Tax=Populus alba x Populus x berolinensis TaxID=444605 RepID=A0AAD6LJ70_9ROSI|nr:hypothetical protein NC653_036063 [Populus alba x Populus x berolinensis]